MLGLAVHFLDVQRPESFDLFSDVPEAPSEPDYYTVNSTFREYNEAGVLSRSLTTDRLLHYPDTEETTLEKPVIITYDEQGKALWQAKADTGLLEGDGSRFQLNQNVIVWQMQNDRPESASGPPKKTSTDEAPQIQMQLTTVQLNIDMDNDQASTEKPVRITTTEGTTDAVGLFVDMNSHQIRLKSQVRGLYQTPSNANPASLTETETETGTAQMNSPDSGNE